MKSLIALVIAILSFSLHADEYTELFGRSANQMVRNGYKKSQEDGYTTFTRTQGEDVWVRALKPNSSAYIRNDADSMDNQMEYLALDKKGKLQFRTSCESKDAYRTANCADLKKDGTQSKPYTCKNSGRNEFNCVTVSKRYCEDMDKSVSWWKSDAVVSESKLKECEEISKKLNSALGTYSHLRPFHKTGLDRIRTHFKVGADAIPAGENPILKQGGFRGLAAIIRAKELCDRSEDKWGDDFTQPSEPVLPEDPYDANAFQ